MKFYIISVNCDGKMCGHHYEARRYKSRSTIIRCEFDNRSLFIGEWKLVGEVIALNRVEAVEKFKNERK